MNPETVTHAAAQTAPQAAPALVRMRLNGTAEQLQRLRELQVAFAQVCNAIAPVVQQTRCWNRVALHHLVYHPLRERFPNMGSQMVCNAIYSVSRSARAVLQHPASPWNVQRHPERPLPLLRFAETAPVYFDRHTLSLKDGVLSMFTLDGRMRFELQLAPADEARFHREKLQEVVLAADDQGYSLSFRFSDPALPANQQATRDEELPEYVLVVPPDPAPQPAHPQPNDPQATPADHATEPH